MSIILRDRNSWVNYIHCSLSTVPSQQLAVSEYIYTWEDLLVLALEEVVSLLPYKVLAQLSDMTIGTLYLSVRSGCFLIW